jgi:hypothetical protein
MTMTDVEFLKELDNHPSLKNRFKEILAISANTGTDPIKLANEAEMQVIEQMRKLGSETLQEWATKESTRVASNVAKQTSTAKKHVKKTLAAYHLRRNRSSGANLLSKARRHIASIYALKWSKHTKLFAATAKSHN